MSEIWANWNGIGRGGEYMEERLQEVNKDNI